MLKYILIVKFYKDTLHTCFINMKIKSFFDVGAKSPNSILNFAPNFFKKKCLIQFLSMSNFCCTESFFKIIPIRLCKLQNSIIII